MKRTYIILAGTLAGALVILGVILFFVFNPFEKNSSFSSELKEQELKSLKYEISYKKTEAYSEEEEDLGMSQDEFEGRIGMKGKGSCEASCLLNDDNGSIGDCNDMRALMPVGSICAYDVKVDGVPHTIIAHYTLYEGEGLIEKFSWHKK